jgi:polyferredoxin
MNEPGTQELLPPERAGSTQSADRPSLLHWLIEPLPDRLLLPVAGLWILGLDWLLFIQESVTLGWATPVTAMLGFFIGGAGVYQFQRRFARDDRTKAGLKALLAGIVVGIPIPVAGTVVGAWILASSGLIHLRDRFFRK